MPALHQHLRSASSSGVTVAILGMELREYIYSLNQRNRRVTNHWSHLSLIPLENLFSERVGILVYNTKSSSAYGDPSRDPLEQALTDPLLSHVPDDIQG